MFEKWKQKRELKRQARELELIQSQCPHEWHIVSEYSMDVGEWEYDLRDFCDLYCPSCHKTMNTVSKLQGNKILEIQRVRKEYENKR